MKKGLWIAGIAIVMGGVGWYLYRDQPKPNVIVDPVVRSTTPPKEVDDGTGEASEPIEPITVENVPTPRPMAKDDGPLPRVTLEPGMTQPPRPDAAGVPQMPYAED